jgi:hypothetical protein
MHAKWTTGNSKLEKTSKGKYRVVGFGLPADHNFKSGGLQHNTCPGALACRAVCYAKQGTYRFKNVKATRLHNLKLSLRKRFVDMLTSDLTNLTTKGKHRRKPYNVVRLHDSGDFYRQEYLDAWATVASRFPKVTFYAYTKSLHLDLSRIPSNLHIIQSLGGRHDKLVQLGQAHSRIFSSHTARKRAGYVDGNVNDTPAILGKVKIGLVFHGTQNLTPAQVKFFG